MSAYNENDSSRERDILTGTDGEETVDTNSTYRDDTNDNAGPESPVGEDGTYRYSYRQTEENSDEYRRPPYMRDEIGGSSQYTDYSSSDSEDRYGSSSDRSSDPYGNDRYGSSESSSDRYGSSDPYGSDRYGSTSENSNDRYSYSDGSRDSGNSRYSYAEDNTPPTGGSSRGSGRKGNGLKYVAVAVGALVLGGIIGVACWSVGGLVGGSNSNAGVAVAESSQAETEAATEASGETEAAQAETQTGETEAAKSDSNASQSGNSLTSEDATIAVAETVANDTSSGEAIADVVDQALPAVVAITTTTVYEYYSNYGYSPFGSYGSDGSSTYEVEGAGSGIIIGDDGEELWIVTNNHVVEDSDSVVVTFYDETTAEAYIKGTDSDNDLAVVGIALTDLSDSTKSSIRAIQIGDSDSLRLGETVIAIGNALGMGQSVSTGCVSAVDREITTDENTTLTTIQTDAAINPGNSGGALLNSRGELIGINVAKDAEEDVEGMGFAIPISSAMEIIQELTTMSPREAVSDEEFPYMGLQLKDIDSSVAQAYNMPEGILVYSVEENTPAEEAGFLAQDIITSFDGTSVSTYDELYELLQYYAGGTTVTVTVQRLQNGSYTEVELTMTLGYKSDYETTEETTASTEQDSQSNGGFNFGR
ncbi:MAG: trypsin-like peptidase domain-containing protein [Lachnospiraceae bacterium]|nr:trypsin-like peptidase domain-containing protein [Lachnospiraceae bacterium]